MSVKFHVIVAAYNCEAYINTCLKMLAAQTYDNWDGVVVDDNSSDNTAKMIKKKKIGNVTRVFNTKRVNALKNQYDAVNLCKPKDEDVIVIVDGDDWLYDGNSLQILSKYYENPNVWMTYGRYQTFPSGIVPDHINIPIPEKHDFRKGRWLTSHLRTCKYFLFKNIFVEDLKSDKTGEFYTISGDCAVVKPMAEMAGREHIKLVTDLLYVYNSSNPIGDGKAHRTLQGIRGKEIALSPRYKKRTKQELIIGIKER